MPPPGVVSPTLGTPVVEAVPVGTTCTLSEQVPEGFADPGAAGTNAAASRIISSPPLLRLVL